MTMPRPNWKLMCEHQSNDIVRLAAENLRLREALLDVVDGYGPNHGSKFCLDKAAAALATATPDRQESK